MIDRGSLSSGHLEKQHHGAHARSSLSRLTLVVCVSLQEDHGDVRGREWGGWGELQQRGADSGEHQDAEGTDRGHQDAAHDHEEKTAGAQVGLSQMLLIDISDIFFFTD